MPYNPKQRALGVLAMKKTLFILLLLALPPARAAGGTNAFLDMMRSMLTMFEMMQLYQDFVSGRDRGSWAPPPAWPPPPHTPTLPPFSPQSTTQLDGAWASNTNLLFAIRGNAGRIYWAKDQYRDFRVEVLPPRLRLTDLETGQSEEFEAALQDDRLVLRDRQGRLALFRRIPVERLRATPPVTRPNH